MKLVDNEGAREIDRIAQEKFGIPGDILMENAGIRIFDALVGEFHPGPDTPLVFLGSNSDRREYS